MDSITHFYREINSGFLNKSCDQGFEISYLAEYDDNNQPLFRKFVHYTPENHKKKDDGWGRLHGVFHP